MTKLRPPTPTRRKIMQSVRQRDTAPEMRLRRALWRVGIRYRVNRRIANVRPDLCFPRQKVAVHVDGCFWHGCPRHYTRPRNNAEFWAAKLRDNQERDRRQTRRLEEAGWRVLRFWTCEINENVDGVVDVIRSALKDR